MTLSRMRSAPLLAVALALAALALPAAGQEFRVFTAVYDLNATAPDAAGPAAGDAGSRAPAISRSLTLFHAGKVYDLVDAADEVIVFEPNLRRFRLLAPGRNLTTTIELDEITRLLKLARIETQNYADELAAGPATPDAAAALPLLRCQLDPRFTETFDEPTGLLTLDAGPIRYEVRTHPPEGERGNGVSGDGGMATAYLEYADAVCRLNYVLHPGPLLPDARLAANRSLRSRDRLPTAVTLRAAAPSPSRADALPGPPASLALRAEHTLHRELDTRDRGLIHTWETQLRSPSLRTVTLQDYQRAILTARK